MTHLPHGSLTRRVCATVWATAWLLAAFALSLDAQEDKKKLEAVDKQVDKHVRGNDDVSRITMFGLPESRTNVIREHFDQVDIAKLTASKYFTPEQRQMFRNVPNLKSFPVHGGKVYQRIFENTGKDDDDPFDTGMPGLIDAFENGTSPTEGHSPKFDRKARFLYLYQMVCDRNFQPAKWLGVNVMVDGKEQPLITAADDTPAKVAIKIAKKRAQIIYEEMRSYTIQFPADPLYITSWGSFKGTDITASVPDVTSKDILYVAHGAPTGKKAVQVPMSVHPGIEHEITYPGYFRVSQGVPWPRRLAETLRLEPGNKRDRTQLAATKSLIEARGLLKDGGVKFAIGVEETKKIVFALDDTINDIVKEGLQPSVVEIYPQPQDERDPSAANIPGLTDPNESSAISSTSAPGKVTLFHIVWGKNDAKGAWKGAMQNGDRSIVFGLTTDLPPMPAKSRVGTPEADQFVQKYLPPRDWFSIDAFDRAIAAVHRSMLQKEAANANLGDAPRADNTPAGNGKFFFTSFNADPNNAPGADEHFVQAPAATAALMPALTGNTTHADVMGPTFPGAAAPPPPPGTTPPSVGGTPPGGGGGGGLALPSLGSVGFSRGFSGGGGGLAGGGGQGQQQPQAQQGQGQNTNSNVPAINFNATLTNQQQQQQQQGQFQLQNQNQSQHNHNHNGHGHGHGGHVVPAPASFLLALLGLPGLLLLWRRKSEAVAAA